MGNIIGQSEVSNLPETKPRHRPSALSRCRGVTLIELSFVIGIVAIIVVAALAVYNAVRNSQDLTTAVSDVSAIRTAVSNWAGNEPVFLIGSAANDTSVTPLENLEQLNRLLPGKLRELAGTGKILQGANPWQGDYEVDQVNTGNLGGSTQASVIQAITENPFVFQIRIASIPVTQHEPLRRRLSEGAEAISETLGNAVTEEGGSRDLFVVYRI